MSEADEREERARRLHEKFNSVVKQMRDIIREERQREQREARG